MAKVSRQSKKLGHGHGWVPDVPDQRDHLYGVERAVPAALPPSVDLRPGCSPVEDQGQINSCTGNALAGVLEFLERKAGVPFVDLSRLFIYYDERAAEHSTQSDNGAVIRDGIKTLAKKGVCSEEKWPYTKSRVTKKPTAACYTEAKKHTISSYSRIVNVNEMRTCLADGFPFVFGFTVYESFESAEVRKTGIVSMPGTGEATVGGHAVVGVGYDDQAKRFIVRNSWGAGWGMAGYCTMPYAYMADRNLSDDFWTVRK